ncbi:MAG: prepilin-type N-terminal cleavage/methylation domain-containing protein [Gemmatimonadetes bacterium]|nr:prepilin-type N-terminal cleavage/methylation domain-containing protein [Gemmatimonadota bacterium]
METDPARTRPRGDAGFSLVEVLVAMVILAIGLLGVEAMAIGASRQIGMANRTTQYTLIATQELETELKEVRLGRPANTRHYGLDNGTTVSVLAEPAVQPDLSTLWNLTVTVTPPSADHLRLQPVTVLGRALAPN